MMGQPANFCIVGRIPTTLTIRDVGPWDRHFTVTNDAEGVVRRLIASGDLQPGQRLLYFDSAGELDEIMVQDGTFAGFGCMAAHDKEHDEFFGPGPLDMAW